jgi:hypothetical protein
VGAILILVAGVIGVLFMVYMYFQLSSVSAEKTKTANEAVTTRQQVQAKQSVQTDLANYTAVSNNLTSLFSGQILWEDVLEKVQQNLYKHMAVESIQITNKGEATITGRVATFVDYAKAYASFNGYSNVKASTVQQVPANDNPAASQAELDNGPKVVEFTINFTIPATMLVSAASATSGGAQ